MATNGILKRIETKVFGFVRLPPPSSRLRRLTFWFGVLALLLILLALLPGRSGAFFAGLRVPVIFVFAVCALIVGFGWLADVVRNKLLWRLSNRLVVTYLLVGFAPVFLFLILAGLAGYVFAGQFAIYAVSSELDNRLNQIGAENQSLTHHLVEVDGVNQALRMNAPGGKAEAVAEEKTGASIAVSRDGKPVSMPGITTQTVTVPPWVKDHFLGLALDNGKLYMRAEDRETQAGHNVVVVSSMPLNSALLTDATRMLGETTLVPIRSTVRVAGSGRSDDAQTTRQVEVGNSAVKIQVDGDAAAPTLSGGHATKSAGFYDIPVSFAGATPYTNWQTGDKQTLGMIVTSRPTVLYEHLVSYSPAVSNVVRVALIIVAVLFGIIELIAFTMAVRLNRTITGSVSDLYTATQQINRGNLKHRIPVTRNDQLAELSVAFNTMTASLARLLIEQKEKERLQNELSIAQEVQTYLFPSSKISLPMLELHGVCKPAQSVSGDYYDFLLLGDDRLGLALGDISGKGISAALLMATLHSAVRAYRIAGEEIVSSVDPLWAEDPQLAKALVQMFDSPARILLLLNRHLYRSTQMEKYATLFLAQYNGKDQVLTYSNAGQLPPLVLGLDGSIKRMDCGGPVVGLLPDVAFEQGRVKLERGDIFVAYSDGVTEPENDFGDFGEERLVEIVQRNKHLPLSEISHQVMQALSAWIGAEDQPDDITLVLARQD